MDSPEQAARALKKFRLLGAAVGSAAGLSIALPLISPDYAAPEILACLVAVVVGGRLGIWVGFQMWASILRFARGWSKEKVEALRRGA